MELIDWSEVEPEFTSSYWAKPIPDRSNDWEVFVNGQEEGIVGFGPTEEEAIAAFLRNWFEQYGVNPAILSLKRS